MTPFLIALFLTFQQPGFNFREHVTPPMETVGDTWIVTETGTLTTNTLGEDNPYKTTLHYSQETLKTSDTKEALQFRRNYTLGNYLFDKKTVDYKLEGKSVDFQKLPDNTWAFECFALKKGKRKKVKMTAEALDTVGKQIHDPQIAYQAFFQHFPEQPLVLHTPIAVPPELVFNALSLGSHKALQFGAGKEDQFNLRMVLEEVTDTSFTLSFKGTCVFKGAAGTRNVLIDGRLVLAKGAYRELERHCTDYMAFNVFAEGKHLVSKSKREWIKICKPVAPRAQTAPQ